MINHFLRFGIKISTQIVKSNSLNSSINLLQTIIILI